ncbi:hypothetical protein CBR_g27807 [Chara braunii]|uniref:Reverse transcriptase domain-containing protein n=1 Tax=Chara braunii TaxID=69332 RepID=A0A388L8L3_CHABU|nr:hypothetical protein CBR_g27807 [Chara braunii]|eukprot:GBG78582.1 hypothetical protein CBR_g27807 [Chara braunii]
MIFVPTDEQADPTPAEAKRSNLADLTLYMMRAVMWNNTMQMVHTHTGRQPRQTQQKESSTLTAAICAAAQHQQQQQQLLASTITRVNSIEAKPSAAPGCRTDIAKQLGERIDCVVNIIGDLGDFTSLATISSTVAAIKTDITKLQSRPEATAKAYKRPRFNIGKFDDYNKTDALAWWQAFITEAACHHVPGDLMTTALYLQLIGGAQAFMNHLAANLGTTIADLHTHITWEQLEQMWHTRFMVRNVVEAAMNETIKWQKIVTTPGFDLSFPNLRSEFFSRSCGGLWSALGNEYDYASFKAILDRGNLVIQTDDKAANERQSQPQYVAKQGYQRPTHNNAVIADGSPDLHAAAASSSGGGVVAALPPKRPKRVRKNKATQGTIATETGQQPWTAYNITTEVFELRQRITLEAGVVPPRGCIYRMSEEELEVLRAQLDDLLDKGWICPSCSPYGAPVLFVRKKNKDLQLCIDHKEINAQTVKNANSLPRIDDLLERLGGATYFSKLDLRSGYHQIEIQPQDRYKAAFKTRYGHFEWVVMPFGLTNAPTTFQAAMTTEFRDLLDCTVLIYLDDILVYSRTLDEHLVHLRAVLDRLRAAKYKANRDKCEFAEHELAYLGHYVTPKGIRPLADKIQAIVDWPEPRCTTGVRSFMGLAGYYQRFVESYSKVAASLSRLQSPKVLFEFDDAARGVFNTLKAAMQDLSALRIYDPTLPTQVTMDASGYGIGAVLEQCHPDGWHPVEYFSQKVPLVNSLHDARKKELLTFVTVLKWWRHFLLGRRCFKWTTDNNLLTYYKTQDTVTSTIGRWMYYIDQFDFDPCHIPGPANRAAYALSRRPDFCALVTTTFLLDGDLQQHFVNGYKSDPTYSTLYAKLSSDHPPAGHYRISDGFLLLHTRGKDLVVVPQDRILRTRLLGEFLDARLSAHLDITCTLARLHQRFHWPYVLHDVTYIESCAVCHRNKGRSQVPYGKLKPMPIPRAPRLSIAMDVTGPFPLDRLGHDGILTVVDRLSKYGRFLPCKDRATAPELARLLHTDWITCHDVPEDIVSDRDTRFMSSFWISLMTEPRTTLVHRLDYLPRFSGRHCERQRHSLHVSLLDFPHDGVRFDYEAEFRTTPADGWAVGTSAADRSNDVMYTHPFRPERLG